MSRKSNIKWRKSDAERLEAEIKRFNSKIYRTRKKHPELIDILPSPILKEDKQKMLEKFKQNPRSEFNKELKSLDRFNRKGAEKPIISKTGNKVTKWEKKEVGIKVAQINRQRAKERKAFENLDVTTRGQKIGLKRGEMGSERMNQLKPKTYNFNKIKGGKEWEMYKKLVEKQASPSSLEERYELYKSNYIKALNNEFGGYAESIIKQVEKIPADKVVEIFYSEQEAIIEFIYEKQGMDLKLDILEEIWQRVGDEYDDSLHGRF